MGVFNSRQILPYSSDLLTISGSSGHYSTFSNLNSSLRLWHPLLEDLQEKCLPVQKQVFFDKEFDHCAGLHVNFDRALFDGVSWNWNQIISTNWSEGKYPVKPVRVRSRERKLREARENADNQVAVDFPFASDWLREWRKFSWPITERGVARPMEFRKLSTLDWKLFFKRAF